MLTLAWKAILVALFYESGDKCRTCVAAAEDQKMPLIIAHRGSPCHFPEETLEGYKRAVEYGADYIEMDVVSTKDGQLICRHDLTLDDSTDIADHGEFAKRRWSTILPNGREQSGFFACNFTLQEIRSLFAKQAIPFRNQASSHAFRVRTLTEVLQLAMNSTRSGRPVGVYIETKGPAFHSRIGLPLEVKLLDALMAAGYGDTAAALLILQSFEPQSLRNMSRELEARGLPGRADMVWLLDCSTNISDTQLDTFAQYGHGIGPDKSMVAPLAPAPECARPAGAACSEVAPGQTCSGRLAPAAAAAAAAIRSRASVWSDLVERAHARGLVVHPYTFRNEGRFMALDLDADPLAELSLFRAMGVDGVFVDCPATAAEWLAAERAAPTSWFGAAMSGSGLRQAAAIASVSVLATLLAITIAWGIVIIVRQQRRRRAKYDFFPSMFNTGDLTWYPPDYRRAVVEDGGSGGDHREDCGEDTPLPTSIMMTAIDSPPRIAEQNRHGDRSSPGSGRS